MQPSTAQKKRARQLLAPAEGTGAKIPFCLPSPRSARSLSHGRVVCTYSLDTIRSTTLTRETVTATLVLLRLRWISHRDAKNFYFYFASRGGRATATVGPKWAATLASCHGADAGASSSN